MADGDAEKARFPVPDWAVRPPDGAHLDVLKNDMLIQVSPLCSREVMIVSCQKVMIDEKCAYYMGRNPKCVDVGVEHASCSRVHALLMYHGKLKRFAIVDLGSSE